MAQLSAVINELVEERGIDKSILRDIVGEGLLAAYNKKYPEYILRAHYDEKTDEIGIEIQKKIVAAVDDEDIEISARKAKAIDSKLAEGDSIWVPFDGGIGRIEIIRAKQVIANKIRKIEAAAVYDEFKSKEGSIVYGVIHKVERSGIIVKIQETLAFLPKSLAIPGEKFSIGYPIRALLKEVLVEPRNDNQLILDRVSADFVRALFVLEIPEVFEKIVEIKRIERIPGYKSKVVVISNDKDIDPVGTCVGLGGIRIKPLLNELSGEKIDVIGWTDDKQDFIKGALKPAKINRVVLTDSENANVWLDEDERSLAIGKMGQNITLASRLTGVNIHLMQEAGKQKITPEEVVMGDSGSLDE